jgi:hypothetical protein
MEKQFWDRLYIAKYNLTSVIPFIIISDITSHEVCGTPIELAN